MVESKLCKRRGTLLSKSTKKAENISKNCTDPQGHLAVYLRGYDMQRHLYIALSMGNEGCEKSTHGIDQLNKHSTL